MFPNGDDSDWTVFWELSISFGLVKDLLYLTQKIDHIVRAYSPMECKGKNTTNCDDYEDNPPPDHHLSCSLQETTKEEKIAVLDSIYGHEYQMR